MNQPAWERNSDEFIIQIVQVPTFPRLADIVFWEIFHSDVTFVVFTYVYNVIMYILNNNNKKKKFLQSIIIYFCT